MQIFPTIDSMSPQKLTHKNTFSGYIRKTVYKYEMLRYNIDEEGDRYDIETGIYKKDHAIRRHALCEGAVGCAAQR